MFSSNNESSLYKFYSFIFDVCKFLIRHQDLAINVECCDECSDLACIFFCLQRNDHLVVCTWDKLERRIPTNTDQRPNLAEAHVREEFVAREEKVGGAVLVCGLFVFLGASTSREEEPSLVDAAPHA